MGPLALVGAAQGLIGLGQSLFGGGQARRARRALERLQTPTTTSSASISDYYNRASASPYDSLMYQTQKQNIGRGTTTGLSMLQDRRSGLAGIGGLIRAQNDSLLKAGATAEQQQWGRLGDATRLKSADEERVFNINKMLPYQKQYSLLASKAAGGNQIMNAGLGNIFGGLQTAAMGFMNQGSKSNNYDYKGDY